MDIPCAHCGALLKRPPSRVATNAQQFCDFRCLGAHRSRPVTLACAVCATPVTVKASRAAVNNAITCSPACIAEFRRRNQIARHDSAERRVTACAECGKTVVRKPSQIEKYPATFCNRSCKARYMSGPRPAQMTGEWLPCEVCGEDVWRTPATRQPRTFCSRKCSGRAGEERGPRTEHVEISCSVCGNTFTVQPWRADKAKQCSDDCKSAAFKAATLASVLRRKGQPTAPWAVEQRAKLSKTLTEKYRKEWTGKAATHSKRMTGDGNPQWQDGRALAPYTPGFTRHLKRKIRQRDGFACRICGVPERPGGWLPIHHIDEGKSNHDPSNLITLCHRCHGLVHQKKAILPTV